MKIDLAKVESQIRKLEELRRIASDPELLSLLETVMVNGASSPIQSPPLIQPPVKHVEATASIRPFVFGNSRKGKKGVFQSAVRDAISRIEIDKPFTGYVVARRMLSEGYKFAASKPGIAVIDALKAMIKKGEVRVFRKGGGSEATLFIRVAAKENQ
ncbi:MAG: hypothetical protein ABI811_24225 [Acidobacteriota bacterium]